MTLSQIKIPLILAWLVSLVIAGSALAQSPVPAPVAPSERAVVAPAQPVADPLGRETPAGMVTGFLAAVQEQNFERAAQYLDLSKDPSAWGQGLARQLQRVLDRAAAYIRDCASAPTDRTSE